MPPHSPDTHRRPLISAVICTYNRAELYRRALAALCGQTLDREQYEVIVVDDGSSDGTHQATAPFTDILNLRYVFQQNAGLASAKNHGLFLSRAPIVLFLDDDDVASADYLEQHLKTHNEHPEPSAAVLGYTGLCTEARRSPLMHFVTEVSGHLFSYGQLRDGDQKDFSFFWGGRSSCKRLFLLEHGVFDPVFGFGAEDIELGYRLSKYGLRVCYNEQARSTMIRSLTFEQFCNRCYRQGQSNWVFGSLHPQQEVQTWSELNNLEAEWSQIHNDFELIISSAQKLDLFANQYAAEDIPLAPLAQRLLYRGYHSAFRASRIKGSIDRAKELSSAGA